MVCDESQLAARLRKLVEDSLKKHLYASAIFYADVLVTTSGGEEVEDVYTLADCYFRHGEHYRVTHIVQRFPTALAASEKLRLLNAQALFACDQIQECLDFLKEHCGVESVEDSRDYAPICVLQGKICETKGDHEIALSWYHKALSYDPYCYDALSRLVGNFLLPKEQEVALIKSLKLHPEDSWLHCFLLGMDSVDGSAADAPMPQKRQKTQSPVKGLIPPTCLHNNPFWKTSRSSRLFYGCDYDGCYRLSKEVLATDPYNFAALPAHIASLVMLEKKDDLSYLAHKLLQAYPSNPVTLFAAGCYYKMIAKYDMARKFFHEATVSDPQFVPAWIAYGHAFAAQDESDQALAAYRAASRLFPGTHLPWLFMGVEYLRTNVLQLAETSLELGISLMPDDPFLLNELGVIACNRKEYARAIDFLRAAIENTPEATRQISASFFQNLGHAYLKQRRELDALAAFIEAHAISPRSQSALAGVGFMRHLTGDVHGAIEYYHRSLAQCREQEFVSEMLKRAVRESGTRDG